jgi:MHS family proline/betaine transporter-like MFS transporter
MIIIILLAGFISDYIKREKIIAYSILVTAILSPAIFYKLAYGSYVEIKYSLLVFSVLLGTMSGGIPAFLATVFYDNQRYSGSSFAYNFGMAFFGGITPWFMFKVSTVHWAIPGAIIFVFGIILFYSLRVFYNE